MAEERRTQGSEGTTGRGGAGTGSRGAGARGSRSGTTRRGAGTASGRGSRAGSPDLEERLAQLEERLQRVTGDRGEQTAYWAVLESILPADARKHLRTAGREQLLAARSILDAWIARMDRDQDDRSRRRESIPVE